MTLWWVERERDGKVDHVVRASCELTFCDGYMSAVHDLQPGDNFWMCRRLAGGDREVVDEYTPPADGSDDRPAGEGASGGEWRTDIRAQVHRQRLLRKLAHVYWPDMPDAVLERVYYIVEDEYRANGELE